MQPVRPFASFRRVRFSRRSVSTHRMLAFIFILVWYAIGLRWIWLYRHGNLFDMDEAGYLSIAAAATRSGDLGGFFAALKPIFFNIQSPATPGITAVLFSLFGIHPILG